MTVACHDQDFKSLEDGVCWLIGILRSSGERRLRCLPEYETALQSLQCLQLANHALLRHNTSYPCDDDGDQAATFDNMIMRYHNDLILRVFDYLSAATLVQVSQTCRRFRALVYQNINERSQITAQSRQLSNPLELLRAQEQLDGVEVQLATTTSSPPPAPFVRIPQLLLGRCVVVTDAGDPDFNGIYCCTGNNGNGFVFCKPRFPEVRVAMGSGTSDGRNDHVNLFGNDELELGGSPTLPPGQRPGAAPVTRLLRCIIAKRFSHETLLWYCSKEEVTPDPVTQQNKVVQIFYYWAKLMVTGDGSPDSCRYPSQSSVLVRSQDTWQTLETVAPVQAPTVELHR